jgi:hypothetical protein
MKVLHILLILSSTLATIRELDATSNSTTDSKISAINSSKPEVKNLTNQAGLVNKTAATTTDDENVSMPSSKINLFRTPIQLKTTLIQKIMASKRRLRKKKRRDLPRKLRLTTRRLRNNSNLTLTLQRTSIQKIWPIINQEMGKRIRTMTKFSSSSQLFRAKVQ